MQKWSAMKVAAVAVIGISGALSVFLFNPARAQRVVLQAPKPASVSSASYSYSVTFEDASKTVVPGVLDVAGLSSASEVIEYQDGEDRTLRKRPGRTKYSNLVIKRRLPLAANDPVWQWRKQVTDGTIARKNLVIVLKSSSGGEVLKLRALYCWPAVINAAQIDEAGLPYETVEIAIEKIENDTANPNISI